MRVAIFTETYFPFISGVVTHIKTLKDGLEANGHSVLIITADPSAKVHYQKDGVLYCPAAKMKKLYGYGLSTPVSLKRLSYIKEFNPDLIHIHTEFSIGMFGIFVAKQLKKPLVYTFHTMYDDYIHYLFPKRLDNVSKMASHAYFRNIANRATQITGPSYKVAEFLKGCGVKKNVHVIGNAPDLELFAEKNVDKNKIKEIKEKFNITNDTTTLCFVGRLGKEKSIDELINLFYSYAKNNNNYRLIIIGDGPQAKELKDLVKILDMKKQIFFTGKLNHNEISPYFYASDLYATASTTETNSISALEAMNCGLLVLQKLDIVNKNQISEGENGYIFSNESDFINILKNYDNKSKTEKENMRKVVTEIGKSYGSGEFYKKIFHVYELAEHQYNSKNKK